VLVLVAVVVVQGAQLWKAGPLTAGKRLPDR
jgi:hypothetical protein